MEFGAVVTLRSCCTKQAAVACCWNHSVPAHVRSEQSADIQPTHVHYSTGSGLPAWNIFLPLLFSSNANVSTLMTGKNNKKKYPHCVRILNRAQFRNWKGLTHTGPLSFCPLNSSQRCERNLLSEISNPGLCQGLRSLWITTESSMARRQGVTLLPSSKPFCKKTKISFRDFGNLSH